MLAAVTLGLVMSGGQVLYDYRAHTRAHDATLEEVLTVAARTARKAAYEIDPALAAAVIESVLVYDYVVMASLQTDLGQVLARSDPAGGDHAHHPWYVRFASGEHFAQHRVDLRDPLDEDSAVGTLVVTVDRHVMMQPFLSRALLTVLGGILRNLLLAALLLFVFHALLTRRLLQLVERFRNADPDRPAPADTGVALRDEIDTLRRVLDRFADTSGARLQARANAERRAQAGQRRLEAVLTAMPDPVVVTDADARVRFLNREAQTLFRLDPDSVIGTPLSQALALQAGNAPEADLAVALEEAIRSRQLSANRGEASLDADPPVDIAYAVALLPDTEDGERGGAVLILRDVTERLRLSRELAHRAMHDRLTGLFNREEFEQRLDRLIERARDEDAEHALCYLDLDQFKLVNDTAGHAAGDQLLVNVAMELRRIARSSDTLARIGGDEFALLLTDCNLAGARRVAESVIDTVQRMHFSWRDQEFHVGASVGVVPITGTTVDRAEVMSRADVACYMAKERGRGCAVVNDAVIPERMNEMHRVPKIRRALTGDRFRLVLQPIVALAPDADGPPWYEALVRIEDDEGEFVPPAEFIASAERYGLIQEVDRRVLRHAVRLSASLDRTIGAHTLSVNLSGDSLGADGFIQDILDQIDAHGANPSHFCFEVTETAAVRNIERAAVAIEELRRAGCRFALDDFGSGLSSFGYLKSLPIDILKVDGAFVRDMVTDRGDEAMVAAIHGVSRAMGMKTVAEWVEDEATAVRLRAIGVEYAQGWHFGRPQAADAIVAAAASPRPREEVAGGTF